MVRALEHFAHKGPNGVISCLDDYLNHNKKYFKILKLFVDNCHSQNKNRNLFVYLDNLIENSESFKYLDVTLNSQAKSDEDMNNKIGQGKRAIRQLNTLLWNDKVKVCDDQESEENVQRVQDSFLRSPKKSVRKASRELAMPVMKDRVYVAPLPANLPELRDRIREAVAAITPDMLIIVWD
ncbi:hypothetical protein ANN_09427 [Periplaneta americana]|uniref:Uncharacterized protein n=1 Tax=Periplaneta americana TaxID=6978 RepID=A0ABQ8TPV9_PERAM|nr:hypothetical protein ANN_09427 [Periplaneta americana]